MGLVSRVSSIQTAIRNCTRDEGRSFEAGSQVLASNHCKLLSSKAIVVSVAVSVGRISRRVRLREASASEPPMCRKRIRRCQNRGVTLPPGSARGNPEACPSGIRHVGCGWETLRRTGALLTATAQRSLKGAGTSEKDEPALVSAVGGAGSATLFSIATAIWPARAAVAFTTTSTASVPNNSSLPLQS